MILGTTCRQWRLRQLQQPSTTTPNEFARFIRDELAMWTQVFEEVGISLK